MAGDSWSSHTIYDNDALEIAVKKKEELTKKGYTVYTSIGYDKTMEAYWIRLSWKT